MHVKQLLILLLLPLHHLLEAQSVQSGFLVYEKREELDPEDLEVFFPKDTLFKGTDQEITPETARKRMLKQLSEYAVDTFAYFFTKDQAEWFNEYPKKDLDNRKYFNYALMAMVTEKIVDGQSVKKDTSGFLYKVNLNWEVKYIVKKINKKNKKKILGFKCYFVEMEERKSLRGVTSITRMEMYVTDKLALPAYVLNMYSKPLNACILWMKQTRSELPNSPTIIQAIEFKSKKEFEQKWPGQE